MYSMRECCRLTGLSYDTLKYYCNEGLVPNVKRDKSSNYRLFDDNDVNWINSLICLKKCGFSLKEMKKYINLCIEGKETIVERKDMLCKRKEKLLEEINHIRDTISFIDKKNELYDKFLSGEVKYYSYLVKTD